MGVHIFIKEVNIKELIVPFINKECVMGKLSMGVTYCIICIGIEEDDKGKTVNLNNKKEEINIHVVEDKQLTKVIESSGLKVKLTIDMDTCTGYGKVTRCEFISRIIYHITPFFDGEIFETYDKGPVDWLL
ncbi:hypothetical protein Glove_109g206 [Diversispora epigaea]|uniref:Uncharacterized protein n=1 Tax=Diversispora epigaea TaxID=1348612 RepID=A0A397J8K9_9GLOM|nr:hypothetical protein Glove_109g206 [Diversispora epigaea]